MLVTILICVGIALVITASVMLGIRSKLKSVRMARTACNYERAGSFGLTKNTDTFLYRNIVRIPRPQNTGRRR
ncbi:MAG: hypothetical protein FWE44_04510 [Defluviitaleaceae bacterium]|nr:hypothetical protein [Defluviitaleaceae bacterium]